MSAEVTIPCHGCGYDLSGHAGRGDCPECGAPVARSLEAPTLGNLDVAWVRRVRASVALMAVAALIFSQGRAAAMLIGGPAYPFLILATGFGWSAIIWLTTTPHPALLHTSCERGRRVARMMCPAPLIAALLGVALMSAPLFGAADVALRAAIALPGAVAVWLAAEYPIALLAISGYRTKRRWHPSWALAATCLLADLGRWASVAAAYPAIIAAIGFYRVLMEIQMREIDAKRNAGAKIVSSSAS